MPGFAKLWSSRAISHIDSADLIRNDPFTTVNKIRF